MPLPSSPQEILTQHLGTGERLLWSGQPRTGIRFRGQDVFLIPFSLMWGGFAIFWEIMALTATSKAPGPVGIVFPLFGLPFVIIGLYLIFGRFFIDAKIRARTYYGITNDRIIIVGGLFSTQTKSLSLRTLTDVSLTERGDNSGTITFGSAPFNGMFAAGAAWPGAGRHTPPSFEMIDDAKQAYDIIRAAQK